MTAEMNNIVPFPAALSRTTPYREIVTCSCQIGHSSHVLEMYAVPYRNHKVSVTVDGNKYNVRIDDKYDLTRIGLSFEEMVDYVERTTKGGGDPG